MASHFHKVAIVTCFDFELINKMYVHCEKQLKFDDCLLTNICKSSFNNYYTFVITSCGSKESSIGFQSFEKKLNALQRYISILICQDKFIDFVIIDYGIDLFDAKISCTL